MIRQAMMTRMIAGTFAGLALAALPHFALAAAPKAGAAAAAPKGPDGQWVDLSDAIVKKENEGKKEIWPGGTAGVICDPANGDVYMVVTGYGIWKSSDQGKTFARVDGGTITGRCETSYALQIDPAGGGRLACFMLDGKGGLTTDGGKTWQTFAGVGRNWDFAAADWGDGKGEVKAIFAALHESGGKVYSSADGGRSWQQLFVDPEFDKSGSLGVFDDKTFVYTQKGKGIQRSTDAGKTWEKVSDIEPIGRVCRVSKGVAHWLGKDGIYVSKDKGATWTKQGTAAQGASIGPMIDLKNEKHMVVAGAAGVFESTDAGESWKLIAKLPEKYDFPKAGWYTNVTWDPVNNVIYASKMGKATIRWEPAK